jgi:hypothetical protein
MNFLDALRSGRPMRRASWTKHPPVAAKQEEGARLLVESLWVYPRLLIENDRESAWLSLSNGQPMALRRHDYLAEDWEPMP